MYDLCTHARECTWCIENRYCYSFVIITTHSVLLDFSTPNCFIIFIEGHFTRIFIVYIYIYCFTYVFYVLDDKSAMTSIKYLFIDLILPSTQQT